MKKIEEAISDFPVKVSISVQWGEMDAALHVNNVIYFRWSETARVAYFDALKFDVVPSNGGVGFILGWQDCKYIFPVTYPDTVQVGIKTTEIGKDRLTMEAHFFSEKHDRIVAISKQVVVIYDYGKLEKADLPDSMRERISKLEGLEG